MGSNYAVRPHTFSVAMEVVIVEAFNLFGRLIFFTQRVVYDKKPNIPLHYIVSDDIKRVLDSLVVNILIAPLVLSEKP